MRRVHLSWSLCLALIAGCATTESAKPAPSTETQRPGDEGTAPAGEAPPAPESAPPAEDGASVENITDPKEIEKVLGEADKPAAEKKPALSADGIDDETPLPEKGPAREAFERAVAEARANPANAARMFVDAAAKTTYFYAALYNAGAAYERAGDDVNAERYYREALKMRPDYGQALTNLYLLLMKGGREVEANRLVDEALHAHADRAGPHLAAAVRAYRKRDLSTVEREALRALRIDERQVSAMYLMAQVFQEQERYGSARFALENALVLEPGNALLHLSLGHVLLKLDEEKKALASYGKAVQLRPELAEAQESYAILLKRAGDPERALAAFQKVAELRPKSAMAQLHLGNGLRATKKYVDAELAYKRALELDPNLHAAHFNLGIMYIDNPFEGRDELDQLKAAEAALKTYAEQTNVGGKELRRLKEYQETTETQIRRLEKRREREKRQQLIKEAAEEEAKQKEAADTAPEQTSTGDEPSAEAEQAAAPKAAAKDMASEGTAPDTASPAAAAPAVDGEAPAPEDAK